MNTPKYFILIAFLMSTLCACSSPAQEETPSSFPNIIILLADDLGYSDLGIYGGIAHTPHLDSLAKGGMLFTDFYAAAPNCSPSRVGLLTGRSPSKVGMYNYIPPKHPMHLKGEEITLAEMLKKRDYRTGLFGKWHVSYLPQDPEVNQPQPEDQGFDYYLATTNNAQPSHLNPTNFLRNGKKMGEMKGYSCDILVSEALDWLDKSEENKPFFLYLPFHEPHKKVASPHDVTAKYAEHGKQSAEYFANVENLDQAIGRLFREINMRGLNENTLILFASDNGSYRNGSNGPLLGGKSFVYEGGIRVPGIIHWQGKIKPEQRITEPVGLIDLMPTLCDIIGVDHPEKSKLDGTSLLPLIEGNSLDRQKALSWFFYRTSPEIAMRIGDYSILGRSLDSTLHTHPTTQPDMDHIKLLTLDAFELYHLKNDLGQDYPISLAEHPEGEALKQRLINRLNEIQQEGPYWNNLPPAKTMKRKKHEWRQLKPKGFSN